MQISLITQLTKHTVVKLLLLLTAFCGLLIAFQAASTHNYSYFFLGWNLFLAWVPLLFALIWQQRLSISKPLAGWKGLGLFCLWLLFWPNAPYLITDLVHLNRWINPAQWMDILLFFAAACTGLFLGLYSLYKVHVLLKAKYRAFKCWMIVMGSIILSSYGIYLGRVQRWNSWDLLTKPHLLIRDVFLQLANPEAWSIMVGFSLFLGMSYFITIQLIEDVKRKR